jgi:hypothetical protein
MLAGFTGSGLANQLPVSPQDFKEIIRQLLEK